MANVTKILVLFCGLLPFTFASGHHAFVAVYDPAQTIEVEGEILSVAWRNPHIRIVLGVDNEDSSRIEWAIEGNQKSMLARMGVTDGLLNAGDRIRVAGNPARNGAPSLFVSNILMADGRELVTVTTAQPRWSRQAVGHDSAWLDDGSPIAPGDVDPGVFRVWSSNLGDRDSFPIWARNYPLTTFARNELTRWRENPHTVLSCSHFGMPTIMAAPDPIEFVDLGPIILLRIETFNAERTIHMQGSPDDREINSSPLGRSVGEWSGRSLLVSTTAVDWHHFDQTGIAQSDGVSLSERFTPSDDGRRLHYELIVTDPDTFEVPVILRKHWVWRPNETLGEYRDDDECTAGPESR